MADSAGPVPDDVTSALADVSVSLEAARSLTAEHIGPLRDQLLAFDERVKGLTSPSRTTCQQLLLQAVGTIHPNNSAKCHKPTRTGTACQNAVSPATGNLTCLLHQHLAFPFSGEGAGVRGTCSTGGCNMRLGESDLSCILCNRGICDAHFSAASLDVPSAQQFQGVCAVCLAQNPSLSELVYMLTSHGQSGTALLVFHNPQADGELGDHLETLLTSRTDDSVRLAMDQEMLNHFPPVVATPLRRARAIPPAAVSQTPLAGAPSRLDGPVGLNAAPAAPAAPLGLPAGAVPVRGYHAPYDQTAQERNNDLFTRAAAMSINPTFTVAELMSAVQLQNPGHPGPLVGPSAAGAGVAPQETTLPSSGTLSDLLARVNLGPNSLDSNIRGASLAQASPFYLCFALIEKQGGHETGEISFAADCLGLGSTKLMQQMNVLIHGHQRADGSDVFAHTPGKMGLVYSTEHGHTLEPCQQTERLFPDPAFLAQWGLDHGEFLHQLLSYSKGVFHPSHPLHPYMIKKIQLYIGMTAFIHALIRSLTQSGLTFKVSYMTAVFFYQSVLYGLERAQGSELQTRMISIGQAEKVSQSVLAGHAVLYLNTAPFVQKAQDFVGTPTAPPRKPDKPDKEKKKPDKEAPRERSGSCPLCKRADCAGYQAPSYLCENPIKTPCRLCNFLHARSGKRKSPCGAPEPPLSQE